MMMKIRVKTQMRNRCQTMCFISSCFICLIMQTNGENCEVDAIKTQAEFNITEYLGTWYELRWLPPYFEYNYVPYGDYSETLSVDNEDTIKVLGNGRDMSESSRHCVQEKKMMSVSDAGKLSYVSSVNGINYTVSYWIISTDYTHYSVTYGCDVINEIGGCDSAHAALWSRRPLLSDVWKNKTHQVFSDICISWTSLKDTIHNHDCPESSPIYSNGVGSFIMVHYISWIAIISTVTLGQCYVC